MIDKEKDYYRNQCFINLQYAMNEKKIFEHYIINHGLLKYLIGIITKTDCKINFILENPKNNLRMKIGCNSLSDIYQLLLINDKNNEVIVNLQKNFLQSLTKIERERIFDYIKRNFIIHNEENIYND